MKNEIRNYIQDNFATNTPILTDDIKQKFDMFKDGTIRQVLKRFVDEGWLAKTGPGTFFRPEKKGVLKKAYLLPDQIISEKYLKDNEGVVGFVSGIGFANKLNLTTQTSAVIEVVSNVVADKKREIRVNGRRVILRKSKLFVTDENWQLLQVMELLVKFNSYSEKNIYQAKDAIKRYLKNITLSTNEIRKIVDQYPEKAQLYFYKMGELFLKSS